MIKYNREGEKMNYERIGDVVIITDDKGGKVTITANECKELIIFLYNEEW